MGNYLSPPDQQRDSKLGRGHCYLCFSHKTTYSTSSSLWVQRVTANKTRRCTPRSRGARYRGGPGEAQRRGVSHGLTGLRARPQSYNARRSPSLRLSGLWQHKPSATASVSAVPLIPPLHNLLSTLQEDSLPGEQRRRQNSLQAGAVAVKGAGAWRSGREGGELLLRHILRCGVINTLGEAVHKIAIYLSKSLQYLRQSQNFTNLNP